ncbi:hypothetical protein KCP70_10125 [Salmonella enterica subsp. enterica]|nr:hypothetical protein KCP70_10125 [Salmonella enterica subsp. enterica]
MARSGALADRCAATPRLSGSGGGVLLVATMINFVNLLVDLLYGVVNPAYSA